MKSANVSVDYASLDPLKVDAQRAAAMTDGNIERFGFKVEEWTRGESCFLVKTPPLGYIGFTVEGLGTKNIAADLYRQALKDISCGDRTFYDFIGQCNTAMTVNDMITLGVRPVAYGQYLAVNNGKWCNDKTRQGDLIAGTRLACDLARCTWGPGETPSLEPIITPGTADLAGAGWGIIPNEKWVINPANICAGDAIVFVESNGIHANGLTDARGVASKLSHGYHTIVSGIHSYGTTLLRPTHIYTRLVEKCQEEAGVNIHYAVNITGHGWRKLMRAVQPFTYVIKEMPPEQPIFPFIQQHGGFSDEKMYETFNMGAGFALYVSEDDVTHVIGAAFHLGLKAFLAGHIQKGEKQVIITPKNLIYEADTLNIR